MELRSESLTHQGVRLAVYSTCAESTARGVVLLIHGFASNAHINWLHTRWVETLCQDGYQVLLWDHRGHGQSQKLYTTSAYTLETMAYDGLAVATHFGVQFFDIIGYSMGARVGAVIASFQPKRVRRLVLAGMGDVLFKGQSEDTTLKIVDALQCNDSNLIEDENALAYRRFADATQSDRAALAACMSARHRVKSDCLRQITQPTLIVVGTSDTIAGNPKALAARLPQGTMHHLEGKDHMSAVGDKTFKAHTLDFLRKANTNSLATVNAN